MRELALACTHDYAWRMSQTILARNIAALRAHLGDNQSKFADRLEVPQSYVSKWENQGKEPATRSMARMAALAGVSVEEFMDVVWSADDIGIIRNVPVDLEDKDPDAVDIQQWDVAYGMGGGTYLDLPVTGETHKFSRSWLRQFTHAPPEKIFLAAGTGDSMMPTILDADIVVIDTSQQEVRLADKIWAASYGQTGIIKRLRPMPDGSVKILSDNPSVPPETAYDGELSVVGRVVAVVRKM